MRKARRGGRVLALDSDLLPGLSIFRGMYAVTVETETMGEGFIGLVNAMVTKRGLIPSGSRASVRLRSRRSQAATANMPSSRGQASSPQWRKAANTVSVSERVRKRWPEASSAGRSSPWL